MKLLVTGAGGFIGQHLCRALNNAGHDPIGIDINSMPECRGIIVDITDAQGMAELVPGLSGDATRRFDACIHLAAIASPPIAAKDPGKAWLTNCQGTFNVLELCRKINCKRVVFLSSAHCVGISPRYMPTDENAPLSMVDTYTVSKLVGEHLCKLFFDQHGLSYCTLRLWNAYGEGQSPDYFLGKKLSQAVQGHLTVRNADVSKDFVHVSDVVRAIILAMESNYVGQIHIGTGVETKLSAIVDMIAARFGLTPVDEQVPPEGPTRMQCDWSRAKAILGWEPTVTFEEGLSALMDAARKVAA